MCLTEVKNRGKKKEEEKKRKKEALLFGFLNNQTR